MHTDPIADLLTRIRNASRARKYDIAVPHSNVKKAILSILKQEGYIDSFSTEKTEAGHSVLQIALRTDRPMLVIKRISKPGRRVYVKSTKVPKVMNGLGIAIISTPKGVVSNKQARREHIGGEVLCEVY